MLTSRTAQFSATPLAIAMATDLSAVAADKLVDTITAAAKGDNADDGILELRVLVQGYTADSAEFSDTVHELLADVTIWNKYHAR